MHIRREAGWWTEIQSICRLHVGSDAPLEMRVRPPLPSTTSPLPPLWRKHFLKTLFRCFRGVLFVPLFPRFPPTVTHTKEVEHTESRRSEHNPRAHCPPPPFSKQDVTSTHNPLHPPEGVQTLASATGLIFAWFCTFTCM